MQNMKVTSAKRRGKNQGDHHVAINKTLNKKLKEKSPKNKKSEIFSSLREGSCSIAAEMNPADQSCITLTEILSHLAGASQASSSICESISNEIAPVSILDSWFLGGTVDEVSIKFNLFLMMSMSTAHNPISSLAWSCTCSQQRRRGDW